MTREEFEDLIGRKADDQEYAFADALYCLTDLDKRDFCAIWKVTGSNEIYRDLVKTKEHNDGLISSLKAKRDDASKLLLELIPQECTLSPRDKEICKAVRILLGTPSLILEKLRLHIRLTDDELEYAKKMLFILIPTNEIK